MPGRNKVQSLSITRLRVRHRRTLYLALDRVVLRSQDAQNWLVEHILAE
jgi:hypothetical protein